MRREAARTSHEVRNLKFEVTGEVLECPHCGFQTVPAELIQEHARLVDEGHRAAAGLLSAREIRDARQRLGLSQSEFAAYLGVGEASVKRWEAGAIQDKSSDTLIRLKTDPEYARTNLDELCRRLGGAAPQRPQRDGPHVRSAAGRRAVTAKENT